MKKIVMDLQKISQWFSYDVVITCMIVPEDKLRDIGHCQEGPSPHLGLDITGSAHQIYQKLERATQDIMDHLVEHVTKQVSQLEAIVSKHTSLNNEGQQGNWYDQYHLIDVAHEIVGPTDKWKGFHSKPLKLSISSREVVPRKHEITYNRWFFEVKTIQQSYAKPLIREAII